jgi:hypothetical protein
MAFIKQYDAVFHGMRYTEEHHGKLTTRNKNGTSVVDRMAVEAGGIHIDARVTDPHEHFRRIEEELQISCWGNITDNQSKDEGFRKIVVKAKEDRVKIRTKTGYYAR